MNKAAFWSAEADHAFRQQNWEQAYLLYKNAEQALGLPLYGYQQARCLQQMALPLAYPTDFIFYTAAIEPRRFTTPLPVYAGMATVPGRVELLAAVLPRVLPQVDQLFLCLNNFADVPDFVKHPKITIFRSQDYGDQRDNGKFLGLRHCEAASYYLTLDDDLAYPPDYVSCLLAKVAAFQHQVVVGVHGAIYAKNTESFFERLTFHFARRLLADLPVSVLGTGTLAAYTGLLQSSITPFSQTGMADLALAACLKAKSIPLLAIARPENWLTELLPEIERPGTLYLETRHDASGHNTLLASHKPWGAVSIVKAWQAWFSLLPIESQQLLTQLEFLEQQHIAALTPASFANAGCLFETSAQYVFSDHYYQNYALALLEGLLLRRDVPEPFRHLSVVIAESLMFQRLVIPAMTNHLAQQLAYLELCRYKRFSAPVELKLLLTLCELCHNHSDAKLQAELLSLLLEYGNARLILEGIRQPWVLPSGVYFRCKVYMLKNNVAADIQQAVSCSGTLNTLQKLYIALLDALCQQQAVDELLLQLFELEADLKQKNRLIDEFLALYETSPQVPDLALYRAVFVNRSLSVDNLHKLLALFVSKKLILPEVYLQAMASSLSALAEWPFWQLACNAKYDPVHVINELLLQQNSLPLALEQTTDKPFWCRVWASADKTAARYDNHGQCLVIIAAYAAEHTLQYAYDSIVAQDYPDLHIVIVDDASSRPVAAFLTRSGRVKTTLLHHAERKGPYACRNTALQLLGPAKFFVIHDADDWAHPEKIRLQIEAIANTPYLANYCRHLRLDWDGRPKLENHRYFIGHGPMTSLFKAEVWQRLGEFNAVATRGDMEYKARLGSCLGKDKIYEDPRLLLFALDWQSNSKQLTDTDFKLLTMQRYKAQYAKLHQLAAFFRP